MSLAPGEDIGLETHDKVDQFIRVEAWRGKAILNGEEHDLEDGSAVFIPAGTQHNIINSSQYESLRLYTIYSPRSIRRERSTKTKPKQSLMRRSIITSCHPKLMSLFLLQE